MKRCSLIRSISSKLALLVSPGNNKAEHGVSSLESCSLEGYWSMYWLDNNAVEDPRLCLGLSVAEPAAGDFAGSEDDPLWGEYVPDNPSLHRRCVAASGK